MSSTTAHNLIQIKQNFASNYSGNAHIQEVIPSNSSSKFPIPTEHLESLHKFTQKNPIYFNSYKENLEGIDCTVYEGDINEYWLNSIKHGSSCQPFYPTWVMSAYIMAEIATKLGCKELVDIGSGDGRIAFCGNIFGMNTFSIEIDQMLVDLQNVICKHTNQNFNPICDDALEYDYSKLELDTPVFFIGGLPQMGGDVLATNIIEKICSINNLSKTATLVFTSSHSKRQLSSNLENGGWSSLIEKHNLNVIDTVSLPTVWTFDQKIETPYIFTKFS